MSNIKRSIPDEELDNWVPVTYCVASSCVPKPGMAGSFFEAMQNTARECSVRLLATILVDGSGCANYGLLVAGEEPKREKFMNLLSMALMPAKWALAPNDSRLQYGVFADLRG